MSMRKPYPSDLTDEQWELVEPVITAWKARHPSVSGHQGKYALREIVNAIFYQNRTGCQWEFLPHDMPPPGAVKYYFYLWRDEGTDQDIHDLLRWQLREKRKRLADPSLVVLDTQSIHASVGVLTTTTGRDAAKRVPGRKRCLAVDVSGLVIDCVVLPASAHENTAGIALKDPDSHRRGPAARRTLHRPDHPDQHHRRRRHRSTVLERRSGCHRPDMDHHGQQQYGLPPGGGLRIRRRLQRTGHHLTAPAQ